MTITRVLLITCLLSNLLAYNITLLDINITQSSEFQEFTVNLNNYMNPNQNFSIYVALNQ